MTIVSMTAHFHTPDTPLCPGCQDRQGQPDGQVRPPSRQAVQRRNHRVSLYRRLVTPIAVHYSRRCPEPLDDLVQVGLLGLLRAAELYKPHTKTPFDAFARPHIRGAILHYLRDTALPVRLPRRQMELHDQLRQLKATWSGRHGHEPSAEELRGALKLSPQQWQELLRGQALARPVAVSSGLMELQDLASEAGDDSVGGRASISDVSQLLAVLDPGLRQVIQHVVLAGWSYRRTAALLKVSPMTVQRRLKRGLAQLREALSPHPAASAAPAC